MLGRVSASDGPRGCRLVDIEGSNVDDMTLFRDILMLVVDVTSNCRMWWVGEICDAIESLATRFGTTWLVMVPLLKVGELCRVLDMFTSLPFREWFPGELVSEPGFVLIGRRSSNGT